MALDKCTGVISARPLRLVDGEPVYSDDRATGEFPNMWTAGGVQRFVHSSSWLNTNGVNWAGQLGFCQVGTGSTPPTSADSTLVSRVMSGNNRGGTNQLRGVVVDGPDGTYVWTRIMHRVGPFAAATNVAEIGYSATSSGEDLNVRALVRDPEGEPTVIPMQADEYLDVTYEYRVYVDTSIQSGTVTINGVDYAYQSQPAYLGSGYPYWDMEAGGTPSSSSTSVRTGATGLASVTASSPPGGSSISGSTPSFTAGGTPAGGNFRTVAYTWGMTQANAPGGINWLSVNTGRGIYQFYFPVPLPKSADNRLTLNFVGPTYSQA